MWNLISKLRKILSPAYKWGLLALSGLTISGALLELASLGLIMLLVSAFTSADFIHSNEWVERFYDFTNVGSERKFVILLAGALILLYILKNAYGWFILYLQSLYVTKLTVEIATRLYRNYLKAPCQWHSEIGASTLIDRIHQCNIFAVSLLRPCMLIATEVCVIIAIGAVLFKIAPYIALSAVVCAAILLIVFYIPMRKKLVRYGEINIKASAKAVLFLQQGLAAIREVKLTGTAPFFVRQLNKVQKDKFFANKKIMDFSEIPRFTMEAFCIALAMGILITLLYTDVPFEKILFFAALFIAAMFRLLPSFSRIQYNLYIIRGNLFLFDRIYSDLCDIPGETLPEEKREIDFRDNITVDHINFAYTPGQDPLFRDYSMTIRHRESVAFVGKTGCGKTTLADIIMGFYQPQKGCVKVDGVPITEGLTSWRKRIGYVPQNIVLFDDTVKGNIAFGIAPDQVDEVQLQKVMEMAQITDFLPSLPQGVDTMIGEGGVRLSGGQRQRIAIARALYHDPELLILDEATSALDNETEKALIDALKMLKGRLTIIMIAHRLSSIEHCDRVIDLNPQNEN